MKNVKIVTKTVLNCNYLEYHCYSHGVEERVLLRNAFIGEHCGVLRVRVVFKLWKVSRLDEDNKNEAGSQPNVSKVTSRKVSNTKRRKSTETMKGKETFLFSNSKNTWNFKFFYMEPSLKTWLKASNIIQGLAQPWLKKHCSLSLL